MQHSLCSLPCVLNSQTTPALRPMCQVHDTAQMHSLQSSRATEMWANNKLPFFASYAPNGVSIYPATDVSLGLSVAGLLLDALCRPPIIHRGPHGSNPCTHACLVLLPALGC